MPDLLPSPLISIITVAYNSGKTIRQTIKSVLNQTNHNLEYIIIDGNSTDNTLNIIKEYEPQFLAKGISYRFISEPDNGIYEAMNKGINLAQGSWVGIINSDDWYQLDTIEILCQELINTPKDIAVLSGHENYIQKIYDKPYYIVYKSKLTDINRIMELCHPATFVRRDIYDKYQFDDSYKIAADWDLLKRLFNAGYKFKIVDRVLVNFMVGGVSSVINMKMYQEQYRIIKTTNPYYACFKLCCDWLKYCKTRLLICLEPKQLRYNRIAKKNLRQFKPL